MVVGDVLVLKATETTKVPRPHTKPTTPAQTKPNNKPLRRELRRPRLLPRLAGLRLQGPDLCVGVRVDRFLLSDLRATDGQSL